MTLPNLRERLRSSEISVLEKFSARIEAVEKQRPLFIIAGLLGAMTAAFARLDSGNLGFALTIFGAVVAACCGTLAAALDYRKLEISREAKDAHALADEALAQSETLQKNLDDLALTAGALDQKRRERLLAVEQMVEAVEAGLITKADAEKTAEAMLRRSIAAIRASVDYVASDFFTVTIFRKISIDGVDIMQRIAAQWTDPEKASAGGRSWKLGEGYTGVAWNNAITNSRGDVIEDDTSKPHCQTQYPVKSINPEREALYKSVAAIPILIGETNEVWGVVTATSSRVGVFKRDIPNLTVQNVEMIRDVARIAALLAGLSR